MPIKFRQLDIKALHSILLSQGINIPQDFFESPKKQDAICVLERLIHLVLGFDVGIRTKRDLRVFLAERALDIPTPGVLSAEDAIVHDFRISHYLPDEGEKHVTAASILILFRYLQRLGNICGVPDVTLSDLLRPTGDRMRLIASAVADYIRFQETHLTDALKEWDMVERKKIHISENRQQANQYREMKLQIVKQLEERKSEVSELEDRKNKLVLKIKKLGEKYNNVSAQRDTIQINQKLAEDKLLHKQEQMNQLHSDIHSLQSQIVLSPDRIMKESAKVEDDMTFVENDLSGALSQIPEYQVRHYLLERVLCRLNKAETLLQHFETIFHSLSQLKLEETSSKEEVQTMRRKLSDLLHQYDQATATWSTCSEEFNRLQTYTSHIENRYLTEISELKQEAEAKDAQLQQNKTSNISLLRQIEEGKKELGIIIQDIEHVKAFYEQKTVELKTQCSVMFKKMKDQLVSLSTSNIRMVNDKTHPLNDIWFTLQTDLFGKATSIDDLCNIISQDSPVTPKLQNKLDKSILVTKEPNETGEDMKEIIKFQSSASDKISLKSTPSSIHDQSSHSFMNRLPYRSYSTVPYKEQNDESQLMHSTISHLYISPKKNDSKTEMQYPFLTPRSIDEDDTMHSHYQR